jgi:hypothetical protein
LRSPNFRLSEWLARHADWRFESCGRASHRSPSRCQLCPRLASCPPDRLAQPQNMRAHRLHSTFWCMCCSVCSEATSLATQSVPGYMRGVLGHRLGSMTPTVHHQVPSLPPQSGTAHGGEASRPSFYHCGSLMRLTFTNLDRRDDRPHFCFSQRTGRVLFAFGRSGRRVDARQL